MAWKLCAGVLACAALVAVLVLPWMDVKVRIDLPPLSPSLSSCSPVRLSVEGHGARTKFKLDGAPTEPTTYPASISKLRPGCAPASIPITIFADSTMEYGEFKTITNGLKSAGYTKLSLAKISRP